MGGLRFLPWVRDGVARLIAASDPLSGALPLHRPEVSLSVTAQGTGPGQDEPVDVVGTAAALLHGPGDVTGLAGQQVIRSHPAPGTDNADGTLFAAVEFDRPDLPWLHTPASPDSQGRLRPWLVLVVVPAGARGRVEQVPGQPLPRLHTVVGELPHLTESWAWAHAQVLVVEETEDVAEVIATAPERTLSRLVCPRRLDPDTDYLAAVVPAFDAGVRTGLGMPVATGPLLPAWGPGSPVVDDPQAPLTLPVYHHWTFRTGPDGDFESLARRLRARPLPVDVGRRPVDVGAAGGGLPAIEPPGVEGRSVLGFEGALASPAMTPTAWQPSVAGPWQARMAELLEHVGDRLTPPLYGEVHLQEGHVPPDGTEPRWLAGLNLDPRYRAAAALGTRVIQQHQEELAAAAWARAAELRAVNQRLRRGQASRDSAAALFTRRVDPDTPGRALADHELVAVTRPVHDLAQTPPAVASAAAGSASTGAAPTVDDLLDGNEGARAATSAPFRRLARPRGPLARRLRTATAPSAALRRLADGTSPVPPARIPAGGTVFNTLVPTGQGIGHLTRTVIEAADPWWRTTASVAPAALVSAALVSAADDPVTTMASNGGDLLGADRFFLAGGDGRLFEYRRLDGAWAWRDHGAPPDATVATSAAAVAPDRVYVRTHDSRLYERRWDGDRWVWRDCGSPPGGTASRPTARGTDLFLLGAGGDLYRYDTTGGTWSSLGRPTLTTGERLWGSPRPVAEGVFVATNTGRLFVYTGQWAPAGPTGAPPVWGSPAALPHPSAGGYGGLSYLTPTGVLVERYTTGMGPSVREHGRVSVTGGAQNLPIVSLGQQVGPFGQDESAVVLVLARPDADPADLRLYGRYQWHNDGTGVIDRWWGEIGRPDGGLAPNRPGPVVGDERDGEVFLRSADGRLVSYSWRNQGSGWLDHGHPADRRGAGPDTAPAPADLRFAPRIGLLTSLLVGHTVDEGAGSRFRLQAVHHLDEEGRLRETSPAPAVGGPLTGVPAVATTITARMSTANRPAQVFAVALLPGDLPGTRRLVYWVGTGIAADGTATGGWTGPHPLPDPVSGNAVGLAATVADLDGDGLPELVVGYTRIAPGTTVRQVCYRVGWALDAAGVATRGWTDSRPVPGSFGTVGSLSLDVVDMTGDLTPDLLVFVAGTDPAGTPVARYRTGRGINRRGRIPDSGWTDPRPVPDEAAVAGGTGAGVAVADITGTRRPDLVVAHRSRQGTLTTRVGFDLDPAGVPVIWSPAQVVAGTADAATGRGCALLVADLRADLVADRALMGDTFLGAAANHQDRLAPAQALAADPRPPRVPLAVAAAAVRQTVRPETAVPGEVLAGLTVGGTTLAAALPDSGDPLRRLLAGLTFEVPTYELLRELSQEHIVPNLPAVAPETMTALAVNPRFVEAYLVGLNHEMSREMLWRGFPTDPRHTWFRRFWDGYDAGTPSTDIPPLTDPAWRRGPLGSHLTGAGAAGDGNLVLVLRGEVLRRFPSTVVTMRRARWTGPTLREPTGGDVLPTFHAELSPDLLLFGFPYTAATARGAADHSGDPGWFFVLREQPTAPRFGLDAEPDDWTPPPSPPPWTGPHWDDLHWGLLPAGATRLSPYAPNLLDVTLDGARFGRNAADMARVVLQRPVMLARHASDLLPPPETSP
ncbi:hypothetical protein [Micromonospora echinofusca]|uniref:Uncharacterized protein n=1 Tax=Micromonospora echinofusca TaxID=47858 RepID=A0ABS3VWY1_MICEH|nr:hypothetical protein [Micromonospora echinofusca]MBO4209054.1 hypothetical protein [Micromonospora echinofusca]